MKHSNIFSIFYVFGWQAQNSAQKSSAMKMKDLWVIFSSVCSTNVQSSILFSDSFVAYRNQAFRRTSKDAKDLR